MKQISTKSTLDIMKSYLFYENRREDSDNTPVKRIILFYFRPPKLGNGSLFFVEGVFDLMSEPWANKNVNINDSMAVEDLFESDLYDFDEDCFLFELDDREFARHIIAEEI